MTAIEDQQKANVPLNRDTEQIYYNLRMLIDTAVLTEPRAWHVSKVNRLASNGLINLTFAQDQYDQHTDYLETEIDELGRERVIAMWANYYDYPDLHNAEPSKQSTVKIYGEISYSGISPVLKVGGGYKTLSIQFYKDDEPTSYLTGTWSYEIDGVDVSAMITEKTTTENNQIKIKFTGGEEYISKELTVKHITVDNIETSIVLGIESL